MYATGKPTVGGDFSQGTVDSAAIFLFELFCVEPKMTRSHAEEIKRMFGPYPASTVNRICKTVERILTYLPSGWGKHNDRMETAKSTKKRKEFGHNISFKYSDGLLDPPSSKDTELPGYDSLSDSDEVPVKSKIVNFMANSIQASSAFATAKRSNTKANTCIDHPTHISSSGKSLYHSNWLAEQCKVCAREGQFAGELTWKELYQAVFEHLSSTRDNAVIQNDVRPTRPHLMLISYMVCISLQLAELLGFTKLDLIRELLTNRQVIVSSMLEDSDRLLTSSDAPGNVEGGGGGS